MKTRTDGIRVLRMLLNERSDEYAREGVFASNPEMREVFAEARAVLDEPDPAAVRADIVAMMRREVDRFLALAKEFPERAAVCEQRAADLRDYADAVAGCRENDDDGPMPHLAAVLCPEETGR